MPISSSVSSSLFFTGSKGPISTASTKNAVSSQSVIHSASVPPNEEEKAVAGSSRNISKIIYEFGKSAYAPVMEIAKPIISALVPAAILLGWTAQTQLKYAAEKVRVEETAKAQVNMENLPKQKMVDLSFELLKLFIPAASYAFVRMQRWRDWFTAAPINI